jgi:hypothetical protein
VYPHRNCHLSELHGRLIHGQHGSLYAEEAAKLGNVDDDDAGVPSNRRAHIIWKLAVACCYCCLPSVDEPESCSDHVALYNDHIGITHVLVCYLAQVGCRKSSIDSTECWLS